METLMLAFPIANFIAVVGVGLATPILKQGARLERSIERSGTQTGKRIDETDRRIDRLEHRHGELRERMAKLEGLREAIAGRRAA